MLQQCSSTRQWSAVWSICPLRGHVESLLRFTTMSLTWTACAPLVGLGGEGACSVMVCSTRISLGKGEGRGEGGAGDFLARLFDRERCSHN